MARLGTPGGFLIESLLSLADHDRRQSAQPATPELPPTDALGLALNFHACGDTERNSRESLVHDWSTFLRKARDECVAAMNVAPEAGYTELRVCIEIATPLKNGPLK
jgi:hypothetical protein